MNFALILLVLTLLTGLIVLFDKLILVKRRGAGQKANKLIEQAHSFFPVFLIVFLLRSFLFEPFRIPSGSLEPTLHVGDFVVVNKFIFGLRFPVIEKKLISFSHPKTGDIVVFRWPPDPHFDFIKRTIGVPGDKVSYHNKILTINGVKMKQTFVRYTTDNSSGHAVAEYQENLNGVLHEVYRRPDVAAVDFDVVVPEGSYFMMGDNRDFSADSRYWGFVKDSYLRGRASFIWMSWDGEHDSIRFSRIGNIIH
jgi:signal peptidase I